MARIFTDGAEFGYPWAVNYGVTSETWQVRPSSGSRSWFFNYSDSCSVDLPNITEVYGRFAFNGNTANNNYGSIPNLFYESNSVFRMNFYNRYLQAKINNTQVAIGSHYMSSDTWYLIEFYFKMASSNGIIQVKVDGVLDIDWTGNTNPSSYPYLNAWWFNNTGDMLLDDIAINDTSGSEDNSWCGDGRVILLKPDGAGSSTQWTPSSGSNYTCVDERWPSNGDTDYVESDTADAIDFYSLENGSFPSGVEIRRVWATAEARSTSPDSPKFALGIKSGNTTDWSSDLTLPLSYQVFRGTVYTKNPDTNSAWTVNDVASLEVGVKVR